MSSKNIYTCGDRTPYTYLIGWTKFNLWYYGKRTKKGCHPSDLFTKYFTSSDIVKSFIKENGIPDVISIRKTFTSVERCNVWESVFLRRVNAKINPLFLNRSNGDKEWDNTYNKSNSSIGTATAMCAVTKKSLGRISLKDTRWKTGEIISAVCGTAAAKCTITGLHLGRIPTNDPRWKTGEVVGILSNTKNPNIKGKPKGSKESETSRLNKRNARLGKSTYRNSNGNTILTSKDDPRVKSGEFISVMRNILKGPLTETHKKQIGDKRKSEIHFCPVCNRTIIGNANWARHLKSIKHYSQSSSVKEEK